MVIMNVIFGLMVPGVDNAAHMGGLVGGFGLAYAMALSRPNRLFTPNLRRSKQVIIGLYVLAAFGVLLAMSKSYVGAMLGSKARQEAALILDHDPGISYYPYFLQQAKKLNPADSELRWLGFEVLHHSGEKNAALLVLRGLIKEAPDMKVRKTLLKKVKNVLENSRQSDNQYLEEFLKLQHH